MHWKVGEVLEARFASSLDAHLDELAYHFGEGALAGDPMKAVDYARRAGERAMDDLAFEAAAAHFERALGSLELVDDASPATRCDLLLGARRRAPARRRRAPARRGVRRRAARRGRWATPTGSRAPLSWCCVSTGVGARPGSRSTTSSSRCSKRRSPALPTRAIAVRAQLLVVARGRAAVGRRDERRMALAREALEMARATHDPDALGYVLGRSWAMLDASRPWHVEFAPIDEGAEAVAAEAGDVFVRCARCTATPCGSRRCWATGPRWSRRFDAYCRVVDQMRGPRRARIRLFDEAAVAEYGGRLADAERLTIEAVQLAERADMSEEVIRAFVGGLFYYIRLNQGRSDELVGTLEGLVESQPGAPVWHVALAGALVECDRVDDARVALHVARRRRLRQRAARRRVPGDDRRARTHGVPRAATRGRHAIDLRPAAAVRRLHELERRRASAAPTTSASRWLAAALGRPRRRRPLLRLDRSSCANERRRRCWIARTHFDWSRVLADRGDAAGARASTPRSRSRSARSSAWTDRSASSRAGAHSWSRSERDYRSLGQCSTVSSAMGKSSMFAVASAASTRRPRPR